MNTKIITIVDCDGHVHQYTYNLTNMIKVLKLVLKINDGNTCLDDPEKGRKLLQVAINVAVSTPGIACPECLTDIIDYLMSEGPGDILDQISFNTVDTNREIETILLR